MTVEARLSAVCSCQGVKGNAARDTEVGRGRRPSHFKSIPIRLAATAEEFEKICQFRYRIYVEEMNRVQFFADIQPEESKIRLIVAVTILAHFREMKWLALCE